MQGKSAKKWASKAAKDARNCANKLKRQKADKEKKQMKEEQKKRGKKHDFEDASDRDLENILLATHAEDTESFSVVCQITYGYHSNKLSSTFEDLGFADKEYHENDISWGWRSGPLASSASE